METYMSKLFVGNLSWTTGEDELREHFEKCGRVKSVKIITDKMSGKSKGFGFVEMETAEEANAAIQALHEKPLGDRSLRVSLAQERQERPSHGGGRERGERKEYRSDYNGGRSSFGRSR